MRCRPSPPADLVATSERVTTTCPSTNFSGQGSSLPVSGGTRAALGGDGGTRNVEGGTRGVAGAARHRRLEACIYIPEPERPTTDTNPRGDEHKPGLHATHKVGTRTHKLGTHLNPVHWDLPVVA